MNGIDELRSTLDRHAADVDDHDLGGRVGSVHQRIAVVRRQRRAAAAGGVALTLAVVGGVALLPEWGGHGEPTPASVAGVPVPETMKSLGYTYDYREGVDGDGRAELVLEPSELPRLVSWVTAGDDQRVEIAEGKQVTAYEVPDFSDFVWVGPGDPLELSLTGSGEVGLAVYELSDDQPRGVSGGGTTYREQAGASLLLDAAIGEPGQSEVTASATVPGAALDYRFFCANGPTKVTLHVDNGSGDVASPVSCDEDVPYDPAGVTRYSFDNDGDVTVRVWLTEGENGPPIDSDELVLGLGLYDNGVSERIAGFSVPPLLEYDGHLWQPSSHQQSEPGDPSLEVTGEGYPERPMLAVGYHAAVGATVVLEHSATGPGPRVGGNVSGSGSIGLLSQPADTASITVLGDVPDDARLLIVLFEQVG